MSVQIKRIYKASELEDGRRVLVDRVWPRGVSKEKAHLSEWLKEIAPSNELCKWFDHDPEKFVQFSQMYQTELQQEPRFEYLQQLVKWVKAEDKVTLLYAAKDQEHNQALVLKQVLDEEINKNR